MKKEIKTKTFKTESKLRKKIVKMYKKQPDAVVLVSKRAIIALDKSGHEITLKPSFWENWQRIYTIKTEEGMKIFKETDDGNEIFFFDLKQ